MTANLAAAERMVRQVPGWSRAALQIRPLQHRGMSHTYVVSTGGHEYVVRIPDERTELLGIDRANEAEGAERAAALGIGPRVLGELPGVGTLITELVPGHPASPDELVERLPEVVSSLRRLHGSGPSAGAFPIHRVVEWHARDAGAHGVIAPSSYERLHQQSRRIERSFAAAPTAAVPCHNHLIPANVLLDRDRIWLLDFEYAGMNDVFFDLATLSVHAEFNDAADERLLDLYFGVRTRSAWARLHLMKVMSLFRQGMSAVVQQAIRSHETEVARQAAREAVTEADEWLRRCEQLAATPAFETWIEDARHPPVPS